MQHAQSKGQGPLRPSGWSSLSSSTVIIRNPSSVYFLGLPPAFLDFFFLLLAEPISEAASSISFCAFLAARSAARFSFSLAKSALISSLSSSDAESLLFLVESDGLDVTVFASLASLACGLVSRAALLDSLEEATLAILEVGDNLFDCSWLATLRFFLFRFFADDEFLDAASSEISGVVSGGISQVSGVFGEDGGEDVESEALSDGESGFFRLRDPLTGVTERVVWL